MNLGPVQEEASGCWLLNSRQDFHQRRLAGPVLADQHAHCTAANGKVDAVERHGALRVRPAGEGSAPTVRLPAAYVAEHVELGYATTTARSQGITVDETHTVAAPGMAREDLYVAMSRGRDLNRTYVVTEPDEDCPLPVGAPARTTRREVLDAILATTHAVPTATETWEAYHPQIPPREPVSLLLQDLPGALNPQEDGTGLASTPPPVRHGPGLGI